MGNVPELPDDLDCIFSLVRAEKVGGLVDVVGVSLDGHPPEPLMTSGQCSDLTLLMIEMLQ